MSYQSYKSLRVCLVELFLLVAVVQSSIDDSCDTMPTEIHITKEEYDDMGRLVRSCTGEVGLNKCEGMCTSQVQPSVVTPTGFLKECACCKETFMRDRLVTLSHCYDPDGIRLEEESRAVMEIRLREPTECKCSKCGDYGR